MKVLALIESLDHVCYRYRIEAFAWALAEQGLRLEPAPIRRGTSGRMRQLWAANRAEAVILQRKLLPLWQLQILRHRARRLLYDFDDAVFQRDSYHPKGPESWQRLVRFWATVYVADTVIAGNDYLARRAASYVGRRVDGEARRESGVRRLLPQGHQASYTLGKLGVCRVLPRVEVLPTCVELSRYPRATHRRVGSAVRLAWIGQRSTLPSLYQAEPRLAAAGVSLPGLQLRVICDAAPRLAGVNVVLRPWSSASEGPDLADCDIGISWLPDDEWSQGKCGLKVLQYMAAGLPVVANPVAMNKELVADGRTGFLAASPSEWQAAIGRLAAEPRLRQSMGEAGRRVVEHRFSVARWGLRFAEIVAQTACREPGQQYNCRPNVSPTPVRELDLRCS